MSKMSDPGFAQLQAVREELAARPDGVLESLAERHGVSYRAVLECIEARGRRVAPATAFQEIWADMSAWGQVTFVVHTKDGVFETKAAIPPGEEGSGYFNIHGNSPLGGHLKVDRCAAIYFVDRLFFGRRSCSVQFISVEGEAMFKVFVGRDERREMRPEQLALFEALRERLSPISS